MKKEAEIRVQDGVLRATGREPVGERASRWAVGGLLALALSVVALGGESTRAQGLPSEGLPLIGGDGSGDRSGAGSGGESTGGGAPPKAPPSAQECMNEYLNNALACELLACSRVYFLFMSWQNCESSILDPCLFNAQAVFEACMQSTA